MPPREYNSNGIVLLVILVAFAVNPHYGIVILLAAFALYLFIGILELFKAFYQYIQRFIKRP